MSSSSLEWSENHLLVLEISCGPNVSEEIHVNFGDSPEEVAKAFVERHLLKPKTVGKVGDHIRNCLEAYLSEHPRERALHEAALAERKDATLRAASVLSSERASVLSSERTSRTSRDSTHTSRSSNGSSFTDSSQRYHQLKSAWTADSKNQYANSIDENTSQESSANAKVQSGLGTLKATNKTPNTLLSSKSRINREIKLSGRGGAFESQSVTTDGSKGQSASERLYKNSFTSRKKRDEMKAKAEEREVANMRRSQYKVHGESRHIVESMNYGTSRRNNGKPNILNRLYEDGLKNLEKKKKAEVLAEQAKEGEGLDDWSCARCGVFHDLPPNWIKDKTTGCLSPRNGNGTHQSGRKEPCVLKCPNCGFEQHGGQRYNVPYLHVQSNILKSVEDSDGVNHESKNQNNGTGHGKAGNGSKDGRILEVKQGDLKRRAMERKMMRERKERREYESSISNNHKHSHQYMSEGSIKIIQKYINPTVSINIDEELGDMSPDGSNNPGNNPDGSIDGNGSVASGISSAFAIDPNHPTVQYFSKPPHQRLAYLANSKNTGNNPKVIPKCAGKAEGEGGSKSVPSSATTIAINSRGDLIIEELDSGANSKHNLQGSGYGEAYRNPSASNGASTFAGEKSATQRGPVIKSKKQMNAFVDRLVYEHQEKHSKRMAALEEKYARDPKTGQKFFKPVIPTANSALPAGIVNIGKNTDSNGNNGDRSDAGPPTLPIENHRFFADKRDYTSFEKRKEDMEVAADEAAQKTLHAFRTMSSSDSIVKKAEARTIDTAFCLYLDFLQKHVKGFQSLVSMYLAYRKIDGQICLWTLKAYTKNFSYQN